MASMSLADTRAHPEYPHVFWDLQPTRSGSAISLASGQPTKINYQVHGHGDIKIVFVGGLGGIMAGWQRQIKDFGHDRANKYSVLVFDNRGMGLSDHPLVRYTTSMMAQDTIHLIDQELGWGGDRSINLVGSSMGGMIVQEIAIRKPEWLNSLALMSTACRTLRLLDVLPAIYHRVRTVFAPASTEEDQIRDAMLDAFSHDWLEAEDEIGPPARTDPKIASWSAVQECRKMGFSTNGDRVTAQDAAKRDLKGYFTVTGYLLQLIAAGLHHKTDAHLDQIAKAVGRDRILLIHGFPDKLIDFRHGLETAHGLGMIEKIDPNQDWAAPMAKHEDVEWADQPFSNWKIKTGSGTGEGKAYSVRFQRGAGHVFAIERRAKVHSWLEEVIHQGLRQTAESQRALSGNFNINTR